MRITSEIQKTTTITEDILCNKCGESCRTDSGDDKVAPQHRHFDGLLEIDVYGGYFSKKIEDGSHYLFSLCETCFMDLQSTFKIPALQPDYLDLK